MARDRNTVRRNNPRIRQMGQNLPLPFVLIICEGEKTEINYFTEIFKYFRVPRISYDCIKAEGTQPLKIVNQAIELCNSKSKWEYVFCVFDRDDIPEHDYKNAITLCDKQQLMNRENRKIEFSAIPSNPCFEIWLLTHFKAHNSHNHRDEIISELKKHILDYEKGKTDIYKATKDKIDIAKSNVKKQPGRDDYSNPSTRVDELVEKLHLLYDSPS